MSKIFATDGMEQKDIARAYTEHGFTVIPFDPIKKRPYVPDDKCRPASKGAELTRVDRWWKKWPDALIAIENSKDCFVIDFDTHKATDEEMSQLRVVEVFAESIKTQLRSTLSSTTKNGGAHYFFKADSDVRRRIRPLPVVDLLGDGGKSILPDQKTYVMNSDVAPWIALSNNDNVMNIASLNQVVSYWQDNKPNAKKKSDAITVKNSDVSYLDDRVKPSGCEFVVEYDKDGFIKTKGRLNTDKINAITHTPEVQKRLANFIGIKTPDHGETAVQSSIFYTHKDENPSMGIRWSLDKSHLIIRDFANHYKANKDVVDYNIVHLYATQQYRRDIGKLSKPEYTTWLIRLLLDAKLVKPIKNTKLISSEFTESDKITSNGLKLANGLNKLAQVKNLYEGGDKSLIMTKSFSMAWNHFTHDYQTSEGIENLTKLGAISLLGWYSFKDNRLYRDKAPKMAHTTRAISLTPISTEMRRVIQAQSVTLTAPKEQKPKKKIERPIVLGKTISGKLKDETILTVPASPKPARVRKPDKPIVECEMSSSEIDDWIDQLVSLENANKKRNEIKKKKAITNRENVKKIIAEEKRNFFIRQAVAKRNNTGFSITRSN